MKKQENFCEVLPDGYKPALTVDATDKKTAIIMNIAALAVTVALMAVSFLIIKPAGIDIFSLDSALKIMLFALFMFAYIVLHELTHGAAYKIMTGRKLTFGLTLTVAYCGVPDIYVYRKAALVALLAPFTVFIPVFLLPAIFLSGALDKILCAFLLSLHIGGCCGDLYDTFIFLFRLKSPDTLIKDTGPKQTFYVKA